MARVSGLPALLACLLLAALAAAAAAGAESDLSVDVVAAPTNEGLRPQRLTAFGRTHYYQVPDNPRGTLVTFHGCTRNASAFFPYEAQHCPECLGFPEHVSHTKQALARRYAVLAMNPQDKRWGCWSSTDRGVFKNDQPVVIAAITRFLLTHNLTDKPVYVLGTSSGGTMALKIMQSIGEQAEKLGVKLDEEPGTQEGAPFVLQLHGIISEEAAPELVNAWNEEGKLRWPSFPPTLFVVMERSDSRRDAPGIAEQLRDNGVPADVIVSPIRQVTPTYFSDRSPVISPQQSAALVEGLQQIGMVDEKGQVTADPEGYQDNPDDTSSPAHDWPTKLSARLPWIREDSRTVSLVYRMSGVQQSLNVAYAHHDAVSDYLTACLAWLEEKGEGDLADLLERWTVRDGNLSALTIHGYADSATGSNSSDDKDSDSSSGSGSDGEQPFATTDDAEQTGAPAAAPAAEEAAAGAPAPGESQAPLAQAAGGPAPGPEASGPVTLAAVEAQFAELQAVLKQLAGAGVELDAAGEQLQLGRVQAALAQVHGGDRAGAAAAAAAAAGRGPALPLSVLVEQVMRELGSMLVQLREISQEA